MLPNRSRLKYFDKKVEVSVYYLPLASILYENFSIKWYFQTKGIKFSWVVFKLGNLTTSRFLLLDYHFGRLFFKLKFCTWM